jgi:hypothetical protein
VQSKALNEAPYKLSGAIAKLASITFWSLPSTMWSWSAAAMSCKGASISWLTSATRRREPCPNHSLFSNHFRIKQWWLWLYNDRQREWTTQSYENKNLTTFETQIYRIVPVCVCRQNPTTLESVVCFVGRGGNGLDADRIVFFIYPFSYFQNEYGCGSWYYRIRMQSGCYSNTIMDKMFYQYRMDMNNKEIYLYLVLSQVYNDIIHNSLKSNYRTNSFDHFANVFS